MPKRPSRIDLLELDIDLRLADLWREAAEIDEWNLDVVAAFMRAAYGKGYCDALTEDSPGSLCEEHAAVVVVALPFLRRPGITAAEDRLGEPDELERRRLELAEERDRALAALKELEFDHRTGKVSDEDYRDLVGPLRRRAAEALRALEPRSREAEAEGKVRAPS